MHQFGWYDIHDIVIELEEKHSDIDILALSFPKLKKLVEALESFNHQGNSSESVLEAIQMEWLSDRE